MTRDSVGNKEKRNEWKNTHTNANVNYMSSDKYVKIKLNISIIHIGKRRMQKNV